MESFGSFLLFLMTPVVLGASVFLTFQTRFVQFRKIPDMFSIFFSKIFYRFSTNKGGVVVQAHKALFTAMSTTIGLSTIVSPVIAIRLGGPGALLGFMLASVLGAAVNFTEVTFALSYRKVHKNMMMGGPMQYLHDEIGPFLAKWYAFFAFLMLLGWSAAQANQVGVVIQSVCLQSFHIPSWVIGICLSGSITVMLVGGIHRIANFSSKLVPIMFVLYLAGALWIIFMNLDKIPSIFAMVFKAAFAPQAFSSGVVVGGIFSALRWGVCKGLQSNEAGVGTQTFPHSMADTKEALDQGVLSMITIYTSGFLCIISGLVTLMTGTWLDNSIPVGITMVVSSFQQYFSTAGLFIIVVSAFLFAFGTILGNSYNGSQCFIFLTKQRFMPLYYCLTAILLFLGIMIDASSVWSWIDYLLIPVVVPHILSLIYITRKKGLLLYEARPVA